MQIKNLIKRISNFFWNRVSSLIGYASLLATAYLFFAPPEIPNPQLSRFCPCLEKRIEISEKDIKLKTKGLETKIECDDAYWLNCSEILIKNGENFSVWNLEKDKKFSIDEMYVKALRSFRYDSVFDLVKNFSKFQELEIEGKIYYPPEAKLLSEGLWITLPGKQIALIGNEGDGTKRILRIQLPSSLNLEEILDIRKNFILAKKSDDLILYSIGNKERKIIENYEAASPFINDSGDFLVKCGNGIYKINKNEEKLILNERIDRWIPNFNGNLIALNQFNKAMEELRNAKYKNFFLGNLNTIFAMFKSLEAADKLKSWIYDIEKNELKNFKGLAVGWSKNGEALIWQRDFLDYNIYALDLKGGKRKLTDKKDWLIWYFLMLSSLTIALGFLFIPETYKAFKLANKAKKEFKSRDFNSIFENPHLIALPLSAMSSFYLFKIFPRIFGAPVVALLSASFFSAVYSFLGNFCKYKKPYLTNFLKSKFGDKDFDSLIFDSLAKAKLKGDFYLKRNDLENALLNYEKAIKNRSCSIFSQIAWAKAVFKHSLPEKNLENKIRKQIDLVSNGFFGFASGYTEDILKLADKLNIEDKISIYILEALLYQVFNESKALKLWKAAAKLVKTNYFSQSFFESRNKVYEPILNSKFIRNRFVFKEGDSQKLEREKRNLEKLSEIFEFDKEIGVAKPIAIFDNNLILLYESGISLYEALKEKKYEKLNIAAKALALIHTNLKSKEKINFIEHLKNWFAYLGMPNLGKTIIENYSQIKEILERQYFVFNKDAHPANWILNRKLTIIDAEEKYAAPQQFDLVSLLECFEIPDAIKNSCIDTYIENWNKNNKIKIENKETFMLGYYASLVHRAITYSLSWLNHKKFYLQRETIIKAAKGAVEKLPIANKENLIKYLDKIFSLAENL